MGAPQPYDPNYPQQPGHGAPAAQEKKRRKWLWIVGALAVLFCCIPGAVIVSGSKSDGGSGNDGSGSHAGSGSAAGKAEAASLNSSVRDGKFEFIVTTVKPGVAEVGDNPYRRKKAQGQFVVVAVTVENIGNKPQSFSPSNQKLFDQLGRSFEPDTSAQIALDGSDITVWDSINPGNVINAKIVYDMPKDAEPKEVELHDSAFSGGVKVSLAR